MPAIEEFNLGDGWEKMKREVHWVGLLEAPPPLCNHKGLFLQTSYTETLHGIFSLEIKQKEFSYKTNLYNTVWSHSGNYRQQCFQLNKIALLDMGGIMRV